MDGQEEHFELIRRDLLRREPQKALAEIDKLSEAERVSLIAELLVDAHWRLGVAVLQDTISTAIQAARLGRLSFLEEGDR